MSLFLREDLTWLDVGVFRPRPSVLSSPAQEVLELLRTRGASFAADLLAQTRMLPSQLGEVLGERWRTA